MKGTIGGLTSYTGYLFYRVTLYGGFIAHPLHPLGYLVTAGGFGTEMKDASCNECKYFVEI
jgi:hypothetical protein